MRFRLPGISTVLIALSVCGLASFGVGSAAPVAQTVNLGNQVSSLTVQPPSGVVAVLSPGPALLSCSAEINWAASPTSSVDGYEIRRVVALTGLETGGPWTVANNVLTYTDSNVALALPLNASAWQVRSMVGSWSSDWVTASVDNPILCLFGGSALSAEAPADQLQADLAAVETAPDETLDHGSGAAPTEDGAAPTEDGAPATGGDPESSDPNRVTPAAVAPKDSGAATTTDAETDAATIPEDDTSGGRPELRADE